MFTNFSLHSQYEELLSHLLQASAILSFAVHTDLHDQPTNTIYHLFWALEDLVQRILVIFENLGNMKICVL